MNERAAELIARLRMVPHPEGGHYAEVYRSGAVVDPLDGRSPRVALSSIYFLLCEGEFSRWHRVTSDEVWCHLEGAPIELHRLEGDAQTVSSMQLGPLSATQGPQCTVVAGQWQAARSSGAYSLAACMVAPAFDFADFSLMADDDPLRDGLLRQHPALSRF